MAKEKDQGQPPLVDVVVMHYRNRLADADNLSIKAPLDAIVKAGLLADDSPEHIRKVTHRQQKVSKSDEQTEIRLIPVTVENAIVQAVEDITEAMRLDAGDGVDRGKVIAALNLLEKAWMSE